MNYKFQHSLHTNAPNLVFVVTFVVGLFAKQLAPLILSGQDVDEVISQDVKCGALGKGG